LITHISRSEKDTLDIAADFAKTLRPGDFVALFGGLGMGKTVFVRGLAVGLGLNADQVSSPTFSLVNEYRAHSAPRLYHFDMYRVVGEDDLHSTGFYDYLDGESVLAIEWSENILHALPDKAITITISPGDSESSRVIVIDSK